MLSKKSSPESRVRRRLLAFVLLAVPSLTAAAVPDERPNILFIYTDDQPYKTVGCYPGSWPWVRTPHLDRLAATGIRFDAAYMGSWCMPSRATLLTGRHPHGIESMRLLGRNPASTYDPSQARFFPAELRKAGYHTAQIGKWHTGADTGYGRDWDHQIVWNHARSMGGYFTGQTLVVNGREEKMTGYSTDNYTRWAIEYIRSRAPSPSQPWYLWLCYDAVHGPSTPAERHRGRYADAAVNPPPDLFPPRPGKPPYLERTQAWERAPDGAIRATKGFPVPGPDGARWQPTLAELVRQVNECASAIDEGVGAIMSALRETGQLGRTLVVFTSDQGFALGEHGTRIKVAPYDANYRSPLLVSMPARFASGRACSTPVNATDLVATFCALAGVKVPWPLHGRDLSPLLADPGMPWSYPALYEHVGGTYGREVGATVRDRPGEATYAGVPWYVAVVQGRHKFIHYLQPGNGEELYDLQQDPDELRNLAHEPAQQGLVARLRAVLGEELRRTDAGFGLP